MFPASYGDSILVSCIGRKKTNILIDMGFMSTYNKSIKNELKKLDEQNESLSLLVFTHIDEDHILGGIKFLRENGEYKSSKIIKVQEVWHNSYKHLNLDNDLEDDTLIDSSKLNFSNDILKKIINRGHVREHGVREISEIGFDQAFTLSGLLLENGYENVWNKSFANGAIKTDLNSKKLKSIIIDEQVKITILSPDIDKLNKLNNAWKEHLTKKGYTSNVKLDEKMEDAFEIFMANEIDSKKVKRNVFDISGEDLDDIESGFYNKFEPDHKEANGSSISFVLEFKNKKLLFLGDSHSDIIEKSLRKMLIETNKEKLYFDIVKISHHGSKHNTSRELLSLFESDIYLISTNGKGKNFRHPHLETIYRIIKNHPTRKKKILFNFKPIHLYKKINRTELKEKYNYEISFTNNLAEGISNEISIINI